MPAPMGFVASSSGRPPRSPAAVSAASVAAHGVVSNTTSDASTASRTEHAKRSPGALSLEDFLSEDHLLVAPRGTPGGHVDEVLREMGLQRRLARTLPTFLGAMSHLHHSDQLLTVSRRLVDAVTERIPLTVWPTPVALPDYTVSLLWHPRLDRDSEHAWFRSIVRRAAEQLEV